LSLGVLLSIMGHLYRKDMAGTSKLKPDMLDRLRRILGPENVKTGAAAEEVYSYDASLATGRPDAVLLPASAEEVQEVVRLLCIAGVPYTPRGYGTNLSGGSIAGRGGAVICLSRMGRILEIQPERRTAVVEPGLTNLDLQNALAPHGFYYAPDPASQKVSTLGGNVGENSGGPHCLKYGVTSNHILGLEVVLPGGVAATIGGAALDPPGYDLRGILVGSEGTLAIVTKITVRILPMPETVATLLVIYDDAGDAARTVSDIVAAGITPATLEMMDTPVMRAVEDSYPCGYPRDAAAVLIAEVDGPAAGLRQQVDRIKQICTRNRCRSVREAESAAERDLLWAGRRGAFGALARLAPNYLVADCSVPRTKLPEALARVAGIVAGHSLSVGNVFHAGDGNLHPLIMFDSRDPDQVKRVHEAGWEIMQACVDLGGTITGEHGVGVEKAEAMRMIFSEDALEIQHALRSAFDPGGLLNPGKMFPVSLSSVAAATQSEGDKLEQCEHMPADEGEAVDIVRRAFRDSIALVPVGEGRRKDFGNLSEGLPLRSSRLTAVFGYDPPNQVVSAGAGMPLGRLQDLLATNGQWLPIRPLLGNRSTLGGIAALGACGPERLRYGAPRDLVLGMRFVSGTGRVIAAGGRVVKNVAGYDLSRLLTGSAGTLGFLTQLTFRLVPLPECCTELRGTGSLKQCAEASALLLHSKLEPAFLAATLLSESNGPETQVWRLSAGFEGFRVTTEWQTARAVELMVQAGLADRAAAGYACRDGVFSAEYASLQDSDFLLRADVPLDRVAQFGAEARRELGPGTWMADFGCGRLWAGCAALSDPVWLSLCRVAGAYQGHVVLEKAPAHFKARNEVFGPARPEWKILRRIKNALDPRNIFAPGRLPGARSPV
jgi:D-lactate dehydrogenase (cytochrome)